MSSLLTDLLTIYSPSRYRCLRFVIIHRVVVYIAPSFALMCGPLTRHFRVERCCTLLYIDSIIEPGYWDRCSLVWLDLYPHVGKLVISLGDFRYLCALDFYETLTCELEGSSEASLTWTVCPCSASPSPFLSEYGTSWYWPRWEGSCEGGGRGERRDEEVYCDPGWSFWDALCSSGNPIWGTSLQ